MIGIFLKLRYSYDLYFLGEWIISAQAVFIFNDEIMIFQKFLRMETYLAYNK